MRRTTLALDAARLAAVRGQLGGSVMRAWGGSALLAVALVATAGAAAWGSTQDVFSQPNREVHASVSLGCQGTNRDRDDDMDTCVGGDNLSIHYAAGNNTDAQQTIRYHYVFDGPGTELDRTFTEEVTLPPRDFVQDLDGIRVQNGKTPLGEYTLTLTVTGAAESATATGSVTVGSKNSG